jgi:hypothetical protein
MSWATAVARSDPATADDSSQLSDVDNNPGRCQLAGGSTQREAMSHEERPIAATSPPTEENSNIVVGRPMSPFSSPQNTAGRILQDGCALLAGLSQPSQSSLVVSDAMGRILCRSIRVQIACLLAARGSIVVSNSAYIVWCGLQTNRRAVGSSMKRRRSLLIEPCRFLDLIDTPLCCFVWS